MWLLLPAKFNRFTDLHKQLLQILVCDQDSGYSSLMASKGKRSRTMERAGIVPLLMLACFEA